VKFVQFVAKAREIAMNNKRTIIWTLAGALTLVILLLAVTGVWAEPTYTSLAAPSAPLAVFSNTISFQGRLLDSAGVPVDGSPMMTFRVYTQAEGGSPVWEDAYNVPVENGLFNASLEIPPALFDDQALWLSVQVEGDAQEMQPRQQLLPAPYALYAKSAPNAGSGAEAWLLGGNADTTPSTDVLGTTDAVSLTLVVNGVPALRLEPAAVPNLIGGYRGNSVASSIEGATIGGGGSSFYPNRVTADYGTIGGGSYNIASGEGATVGGGHGNTVSGTLGTIGGGYINTASSGSATVGGGILNTASGDYATVSGGEENTSSGSWATIGGGFTNVVSGTDATIGGGMLNAAGGDYTTIGGGLGNYANGNYATISGGVENTASGYRATVGGGWYNNTSGDYATISGGTGNAADGDYATVSGGYYNIASGDYSFAAGRRARAAADGCFVWGDSTDAAFNCSNPDRFMVRASGGVYLYTNPTVTLGAYLAPNSGSWSSLSDRNAKENFQSVDPEYVLEQVVQMPVSTWNYIGEAEGIRHLGPMAQDFYVAFGLGDSERYINTLDADGVALAAIQGLYAKNQTLTTENAALQTRVNDLEIENATQEKTLNDLEARLAALEQAGTPHPAQPIATWWLLVGLAALAGIAVARRRHQEITR
jgi:hypothetical protein